MYLDGPRMMFSVVIPTRNRCDILRTTLMAWNAQTFPAAEFEVIVVDDASTDRTADLLTTWNERISVRYLRNEWSGAAVARNTGSASAAGMYLVFLDDDVAPLPDWLEKCRLLLEVNPMSCLAGTIVGSGDSFLSRFYNEMNICLEETSLRRSGRLQFQSSLNFVCQRDLFKRLGGFDERFFVGGEDRDLFARILESGETIERHTTLCAIHRHPFTLTTFMRTMFHYGRASHVLEGLHDRLSGGSTIRLRAADILAAYGMVINRTSIISIPAAIIVFFLAQTSALMGRMSARLQGLTTIRRSSSASGAGRASSMSSRS